MVGKTADTLPAMTMIPSSAKVRIRTSFSAAGFESAGWLAREEAAKPRSYETTHARTHELTPCHSFVEPLIACV